MQDQAQPPLSTTSIQTDKTPTKQNEDSQISTSTNSSNASSRNPSLSHWQDSKEPNITSPEDTKFPMWTKASKSKPKSNNQSFRDNEVIDDTVTEEGEEEETENQFLKKLPMIADGEEFNVKKTHINRFGRRENIFSKDLNRCRSLDTSFLPLDAVAEDKNDEEEQNAFKQRRKFKLQSFKVEDLNEFNRTCLSDRGSFERKEMRNLTATLKASKDVIVEEQENRVLPHLQSTFGSYSNGSSRRGSHMAGSSPGHKLRVDEIDMWGKPEVNKEDSDDNEIDTIVEETEEKNGQENKEFQVAIAKLGGEREFLKKVEKGEMLDENSLVFKKRASDREYSFHGNDATEEIIEEDNNENIGN